MPRRNGKYESAPREQPCSRCGIMVFKLWRRDRTPYCDECASAVATEAAKQMHEKSGPYYDAWLASRGIYGRPAARPTPLPTRWRDRIVRVG